jgi:hypothetical protein
VSIEVHALLSSHGQRASLRLALGHPPGRNDRWATPR